MSIFRYSETAKDRYTFVYEYVYVFTCRVMDEYGRCTLFFTNGNLPGGPGITSMMSISVAPRPTPAYVYMYAIRIYNDKKMVKDRRG